MGLWISEGHNVFCVVGSPWGDVSHRKTGVLGCVLFATYGVVTYLQTGGECIWE